MQPHTHTSSLVHAPPLHQYMHSPALVHTHTHTHTLVPNYNYTREMPNKHSWSYNLLFVFILCFVIILDSDRVKIWLQGGKNLYTLCMFITTQHILNKSLYLFNPSSLNWKQLINSHIQFRISYLKYSYCCTQLWYKPKSQNQQGIVKQPNTTGAQLYTTCQF